MEYGVQKNIVEEKIWPYNKWVLYIVNPPNADKESNKVVYLSVLTFTGKSGVKIKPKALIPSGAST